MTGRQDKPPPPVARPQQAARQPTATRADDARPNSARPESAQGKPARAEPARTASRRATSDAAHVAAMEAEIKARAEWDAYAARHHYAEQRADFAAHRPDMPHDPRARDYAREQEAYREGYDREEYDRQDYAYPQAAAASSARRTAADTHAPGGPASGNPAVRRAAPRNGASPEAAAPQPPAHDLAMRGLLGRCADAAHAFARLFQARWFRRVAATLLAVCIVGATGFGLLWWRLGAGPLNLDVMTPWLASAIGDNFGKDHRVTIGGTQIERAGRVRMALRIRDVVVRDKDDAIVASAPKAEVKLSGVRLLIGRLRAESLSLVGAELSVRIEHDGRVIVSAGGDARPLATSDVGLRPSVNRASAAPNAPASSEPAASPTQGGMQGLMSALAWIDGLGASGLDGHDLSELGLKNGTLTVDDRQSGRNWTFDNISLSLRRPRRGGVELSLGQEGAQHTWSLNALVGPPTDGVRGIDLVANRVSMESLLLALRMNDLAFTSNLPISGRIRGQIGRDGLPTFLTGQMIAEAGEIIERKIPQYPMTIDRAEIGIEWDAARRTMIAPFQILSGANRITLLAHLEPPNDRVPHWQMGLSGGSIVLSTPDKREQVVYNRIAVRLRFDTDTRRVVIERGDISNGEFGFAGSGHFDYSTSEPRLILGFAGTPMPASAVKLSWPVTVAPEVREWVLGHIGKGTVQRLDVSVNAPSQTLVRGGPPPPDDGLAIDVVANNVTVQPVASLPALQAQDLRVRVTGRTATVTLPQASLDTPAGRKLNLSDLAFEVADTAAKPPQARVRFRAEGQVPAAAEILAMDRLSDFSGTPVDPNGSKGTVNAAISLAVPLKADLAPGETGYALNVDLTNFAAEKMVLNQKLEANTLKIAANSQGYQIKGDVKIGGLPAALDYRKPRGDGDAEVRLTAVTDDATRAKLGFDLGTSLSGPVTLKLNGRIAGAAERESRIGVDADLTAAKVDNLLPGWVKPAGKATRAQFVLLQKPQSTRFEDLVVEGGGTQIKGNLEVTSSGEVINAAFPVFHPSDADRASLRAERAGDGTLKVSLRGEVFDGRGFIKAAVAGNSTASKQKTIGDLDLELKLGAVAGYNGEAVRGLDVKMSRRGSVIRSFSLAGKIGRDSPMSGDLRGRAGGRDVLYLEANDAGAFFRFTDTYPKMFGGQMWVAMDPPTGDEAPKEGLLNVRDFHIKGEGALDRVVAKGPHEQAHGVPFSAMRVEFTRQPGRLTVHDGVVRGPIVGATIDGTVDYTSSAIQMRGTFVPLYGLNNMFGQIPIVGVFLGGGSNEGLLGVTFEVVGSPGAPVLRVNPISAVAPGRLRKFFYFPVGGRGAAQPSDRAPP